MNLQFDREWLGLLLGDWAADLREESGPSTSVVLVDYNYN